MNVGIGAKGERYCSISAPKNVGRIKRFSDPETKRMDEKGSIFN